jgi:hypothetical protein
MKNDNKDKSITRDCVARKDQHLLTSTRKGIGLLFKIVLQPTTW